MKKIMILGCLLSLLLSGCSVDRLAILLRQYHSGTLTTEKAEELERKFASAKAQFASDRNKELLVLYIEGLTYEKRKDYPRALSIFKQIMEADDSMLDAWLHIAQINSLLNRKAEARKAYSVCIEIIEKEILYIEANKWPDNHILSDDHVQYAVRYSMIDNSYLPSKQAGENREKINYVKIKENLLNLKRKIEKSPE